MSIEARGITKHFGSKLVLDGVDLTVPEGGLVALLGPSGSGKTTLLRILAGLEAGDEGRVSFHGEDVTDKRVGERKVGFVFQHYALFRHMTVVENVAFGLRVKPWRTRPSRSEIKERARKLLALVQLAEYEEHLPSELSGGQRQRIALARALAVEPRVLLLDEPFGALDAQVRQDLRKWLRKLHDEINMTSVFVTHDQDEALEIADRVVVLNQGRVEQADTPNEVYHQPASEFVMGFLGRVDRFDALIENGAARFGPWRVSLDGREAGLSGPASVFLRPHNWEIDVQAAHPSAVAARIENIHSASSVVRVTFRVEPFRPFEAEISHRRLSMLAISEGADVFVWPRRFRVFSDQRASEPALKIDSSVPKAEPPQSIL